MTEDQDRLAEVANLVNMNGETFPCPAAIVIPGPSHTVKAPISSAFQASSPRLTASTFSCDIAYSDSPAASRASLHSALKRRQRTRSNSFTVFVPNLFLL